jgi:ATP-binding cassette subfamily B protein
MEQFINMPEDKNLYDGQKITNLSGDIKFSNVNFQYDHTKVLSNISFHIKKGTSIALVGESGGGKSTIIKLVLGLLKKTDGNIEFDGIDIDKIELDSLYDSISYISQESPIFDASIRENIVFDENRSDEELFQILGLVNLSEKVKQLPEGLNTIVGERGHLLSGGERQRLAVARVIAQNKNIIVLDEPVSALDCLNEANIMEQLITIFADKVVIIVAHRLQYIKDVDQIIVIKDGSVIATGNFSTLIKTCLYFVEIWEQANIQK